MLIIRELIKINLINIYGLLIIHRLVMNRCGLVVKGVASRSEDMGTLRFRVN